MRRYAIAPAAALVLASFCTVASLVAPEWTWAMGVDFWNYANECEQLRDCDQLRQDLEWEEWQSKKRAAASDQIALSLCEGQIRLPEAIGDMAALAESDPRWFASVRYQYCLDELSTSASDREVITLILRKRMQMILIKAQYLGDKERATFVAARLAHFDDEVRGLAGEVAIAQAKP